MTVQFASTIRDKGQASDRLTFARARDMFIDRCHSMNLTEGTIRRHYMNSFNMLEQWMIDNGKPLTFTALSSEAIRAFLAYRTKTVSASAAQHDFLTLRCLCRFLLQEEVIDKNPMQHITKPKVDEKPRKVYSQDDVKQLLSACSGNSFTAIRDTAIIMTFSDTGLRASELAGLCIDDVDLHTRTLVVQRGKGGKAREVPFGRAMARILQKWLAKRGDELETSALFVGIYGEPLQPRGILAMVKRIGKRAGLNRDNCQLHAFRRYSAIESLRGGMSPFTLQRKLGHSDLTMTRHYCQLANSDLRREQDIASPGDRLVAVNKRAGKKRLR